MTLYVPNQDLAVSGWSGSTGSPSIITSKQPWRQQPQGAVEVVDKNFYSVWLPVKKNGFDVLRVKDNSASVDLSTNYLNGFGIHGKYINCEAGAGTSAGAGFDIRDIPSTNKFTLVISHELLAGDTGDRYLWASNMEILPTSTTALGIYVSGGLKWSASWGSIAKKSIVIAADGSVSSNVPSVFVDGIPATVTTNSASTFTLSGQIIIGNHGTLNRALNARVYMAAFATKNIIYGKSLSDNPWQIFKPQKRIIYSSGVMPVTSDLYTTLDESTTDDADYISTTTADSTIDLALPVTALSDTNTIKYRAASPEADRGLIVQLREQQAPVIVTSKQPWRQQPQRAVEIDRNKQNSKHLELAILPNIKRNLAKPEKLITTSSLVASKNTLSAVAGGAQSPITLGGAYISGNRYTHPANTSFTLIAHIPKASLVGSNPGLWREGSTNIGTTFTIVQGAGSNRPWIRLNGTDILKPSTGNQIVANSDITICYRVINATEASVFWNGVKQHTATHSIAVPQLEFFVFGFQSDTGQYIGDIASVFLYSTALSDSQIIEITKNPYGEIFKPQQRTIYSFPSSLIATHTKTAGDLGTSVAEQSLILTEGQEASIVDPTKLFLRLTST